MKIGTTATCRSNGGNYCKENNIPVFMKDSMRAVWGEDIITEFPWDD